MQAAQCPAAILRPCAAGRGPVLAPQAFGRSPIEVPPPPPLSCGGGTGAREPPPFPGRYLRPWGAATEFGGVRNRRDSSLAELRRSWGAFSGS